MKGGFLKPSVQSVATQMQEEQSSSVRDDDADGLAALVDAVRCDNWAVFCWLVLSRPELVNLRCSGTKPTAGWNDTALLCAARHRPGDGRYVELLLSAGASARERDARSNSALHLVSIHKGLSTLRTIKALLMAPGIGVSCFDQPNRIGHRALDACGSYEAHELLLVATAWLDLGRHARTVTLVSPHVFVACCAVLERATRKSAWVSPLVVLVCVVAALFFWRSRSFGAAIAHPQSLLGVGFASALAVACGLSTASMLASIRRQCSTEERVDDAWLLSYGHLVVYLSFLGNYFFVSWVSAPPIAERSRCVWGEERASFIDLARRKPKMFTSRRFCSRCASFRPSSSPDYAHCSRCAQCFYKRHHHCALLGRCVAGHNRLKFCSLLGVSVLCGVSCFRVAAWFFALRCGLAELGPVEPKMAATIFAHPATFARCALAGHLGPTAALNFLVVPVGCLFVSYTLAQQILQIAGVNPYDIIDRAHGAHNHPGTPTTPPTDLNFTRPASSHENLSKIHHS